MHTVVPIHIYETEFSFMNLIAPSLPARQTTGVAVLDILTPKPGIGHNDKSAAPLTAMPLEPLLFHSYRHAPSRRRKRTLP